MGLMFRLFGRGRRAKGEVPAGQSSEVAPPRGARQPGMNSQSQDSLPEGGGLTNAELLKRMFQFVRPVKATAIVACALVAVAVLLDTSAANLTRIIIDQVKDHLHTANVADAVGRSAGQLFAGPLRHVVLLIAVLTALVVGSSFNGLLRNIVNTRLSMDMVYHMRAAVYDQLQRVGFGFHDVHPSGQLINRALSDLHNIRFFVNLSLVQITEIVLYVIGYDILLWSINPWIGLVALLPTPFWFMYLRHFSRRVQPIQKRLMASGDELVTVLSENVAGVHVVKAFATETTEVKKYNQTADVFYGHVMQNVGMYSNFVPIFRGIAIASSLTLFWLGSILVVRKSLQVGDLIVFGVAMGNILSRLQQLNQISTQYQQAIVSARRFFEILCAPPTIEQLPDAPPLPAGEGSIEFRNVTFGYSSRHPVLHDVTFSAPGGSVIALVGPTGAGKSTLVQLLARFYDPQSGAICIDGCDIKTARLASVRDSVGFVFQETFLFSDTVAANIRYGHASATDGEIEAAARIAQAHEFIMELPYGYETILGERGATLSGGQRQRLAIARAIVANPRILVLDDALAAVDPETEKHIRRALALVMAHRTVMVIAHRLSTVKAANMVLVLEDGRITQMGTHAQLIKQAGHYRDIARLQLAGDENSLLAETRPRLGAATGVVPEILP